MADEKKPSIYVASKVRHAPMWKVLRDECPEFDWTASWIDVHEVGAITDWSEHWEKCLKEASTSCYVLVFTVGEDRQKGALSEVGAALANRVPVLWVGDPTDYTVTKHKLVHVFDTIEEALAQVRAWWNIER